MKQKIKRKKSLLKTIYEENWEALFSIMVISLVVGIMILSMICPTVSLAIICITLLIAILILSIYKISSFIVHMLDISRLPLTKEEMKNRDINTILEYFAFLAPICIRKKREITPDGTPKNCGYYRLSEVKTAEIYKSMISIFGEENVSVFLKQSINAINIENFSSDIEITDIEIIRKNIRTQGKKYVENGNTKTSIWKKTI